jgi:uncharacterized protein
VSADRGPWCQTFSGRQWFPATPRAEEVHLEDIWHALSLLCRFGGHCLSFYSVAEHSVRVAQLVAKWAPFDYWLQLHALYHDASEAYLIDVPRPVKVLLPEYKEAEKRTHAVILEAIGFPPLSAADAQLIKLADDTLLATERRDLMNPSWEEWGPLPQPMLGWILPWDPGDAKMQFIAEHRRLISLVNNAGGGA